MNDDGVLVVGAGPVGLTSAYWLAQAGIPVVVVEQAQEPPHDMRASTFHPPTLDLLDEHGVTADLIARGEVAPEWQIQVHETGDRARFDLGVLADDTSHPYRLQCEQWKLGEILLERLAGISHAKVLFGHTLKAINDDDEGGVTAVVEKDEVATHFRPSFLVGADGSHSRVREARGIAFEGHAYPETLILMVTSFPFEDHIDGLCKVNYFWRENGNYSLLRVPGRWRCGSRLPEDETVEQALSDASVEARLQAILPRGTRYSLDARGSFRVHRRVAETFRQGRVLLAGDAAHLNDPQGGMGMNGGIHDAVNLAHKLIDVLNGADASLLDRYDRQRRRVAVEDVQVQAETMRAMVRERGAEARRERLAKLQRIAEDPVQAYLFLRKTSMIESLRHAEGIE